MSIREDFNEFIKPEKLKESNKLTTRDLIFVASYVKSAYVFEDFVNLFVEDIIPSVAAVAVEGLTINLNPARVEIMGES